MHRVIEADPFMSAVPHLLTEISAEDARAAGELIAATWPKEECGAAERAEQLLQIGRDYQGPESLAPRSMLVHEGDRVIAHALAFARQVRIGDWEPTVLALAMVATDREQRGKGLGAMVVKACFDLVDEGIFPCSLFQTSFPVEKFYERLGATRVENQIVNSLHSEDPQSNPFWDDLVMRYPAKADWPEGKVDLLGAGY